MKGPNLNNMLRIRICNNDMGEPVCGKRVSARVCFKLAEKVFVFGTLPDPMASQAPVVSTTTCGLVSTMLLSRTGGFRFMVVLQRKENRCGADSEGKTD